MFKTELAPVLATVLNTSKKLGYLPKSLREGTISILYKKKDREDIRNYRPITLLNLDYKLMTKALCNRMGPVMNYITSKRNTGFVPGRFIVENPQFLRMVQAKILEDHQKYPEVGGAFVFLDMEKAFDRVSWDFLNPSKP